MEHLQKGGKKKGDYCLVNMWIRYRIVYKLEYGETVPNVAPAIH